MIFADLTQREVDPPSTKWCDGGHEASALYRRSGPNSLQEPTRFFAVISKSASKVNGIYCEPCLVVAHYLAKAQKKG